MGPVASVAIWPGGQTRLSERPDSVLG
jgi:hypothetical protein